MSRKSLTVTEISNRRKTILEIRQQYKDEGKKLTSATLLSELKKKGYEITRRTLYDDRVELAKGNNYVRSIAEATYSEDIENMMESLQLIEDKYWEWMQNPPQIKKQKVELDGYDQEKKPIYKVIESSLETVSPLAIARNIQDVVMAKKDLLSGDVLRVSIALLGEKFQLMEQQAKEAEQTNVKTKPGRKVKLKLKELPDKDA